MKILKDIDKGLWNSLIDKGISPNQEIVNSVNQIIDDIKINGDKALLKYINKWDYEIGSELKPIEINLSANKIDPILKEAIDIAYDQIYDFHNKQIPNNISYNSLAGISLEKKFIPFESVGLYVPGGSAPLFSTVLMLGIPAQIAANPNVVLCSPPGLGKEISPAIQYAALKCGISKIFPIGGAQAIAAMALGCSAFKAVNKLFGPGNSYVNLAKMKFLSLGIPIDLPAGPSELLIWANNPATASFVASDLLSQAEHGPDSRVVLISQSEIFIQEVISEIEKQCQFLSRKEIINEALKNALFINFSSEDKSIEFINAFAPEHLILNGELPESNLNKIINAGSIFLGNYTPESLGDYASGSNHTLPTAGMAKSWSGLGLIDFYKSITVQKSDFNSMQKLSNTVISMANAEGLDAHANAIKIRL